MKVTCISFGLLAFSLLCIAGNPFMAAIPSRTAIFQAEDNSVKMNAADARIQGPNARLEGSHVMWWTSSDTSLCWTARIQKPGHYRVELTYAIIGHNNGNPLGIMIGDQIVKAIPKAGSGFDDFRTAKAGEVTISSPGDLPIVLKPMESSREYVINIRSVSLLPAEMPTEAIDISGTAIKQSDDGSFLLAASDAQIAGINAQLETKGEKNIGFWNDVGTSLIWSINVEKPGNYRVEIEYSLMRGYEGSKVAISVGDQTIRAKPKATKAWTDYQIGQAGEVAISQPGDLPVVVNPVSKPYGFVMNLRSVALVPAGTPINAIDISDKPITQGADGSLKLTATNAEIDGQAVRIEGGESKVLVWWNSPDRFIKWPIKISKPGAFGIELTYSLAKSSYSSQIQVADGENKFTTAPKAIISDSSDITVNANDQSIAATLTAGRDLDDFKTETLGKVTFEKEGEFEVVLKSPKELGALVMHLRSVSLVPVTNE